MRRLLVVCGFVAVAASAVPPGAAAPVPTHLMPKAAPFAHPTAVGTKWVYERGGQDETWVVTAAEKKDQVTLIDIRFIRPDGTSAPCHKLSLGLDGLCMTEESGHPYTPAWRQLTTPLGREHKWDLDLARQDIGGGIKGSTVQAERLERVKVPAGEFDAVRVGATYRIGGNAGGETKSICWYASGVGLVKQGEGFVLKSFTPGKG